MSEDIRVETVGLSELVRRYQNGDVRARLGLYRATRSALEHLRTKVADYPSRQSSVPRSLRGKWFKSERQRRWFFAALRSGEITVPYRRTGTLGRRWMIDVRLAEDVLGLMGNATPYAPYVQDLENQARIHQGNWQTVQQVVEEEQEAVVDYYAEEIKTLVSP
jgi:hypothetical protein